MLTQEQQEKQIGILLKKPENAICADCSSKSPCWASLDFGVFVCMNCSGAHRSLGQSVTRIKSTKLDTWNRDWLWHMQLNNKMINQYYEASLNPVLHKKPNPNSSLQDIKKFVYDKYVRKLFSPSGQDDPITNLKNNKPPFPEEPIQITTTPTTTTNTTAKIQSKPITVPGINPPKSKNIENLLDQASSDTNRVPSESNDKIRQDVNLFGVFEDIQASIPTPPKNTAIHEPVYNKTHYNSFSGQGASHSSTGCINFDDIFGPHTQTHTAPKQQIITFQDIKPPQSPPHPQIYSTSTYQTTAYSNQPTPYNQCLNTGIYQTGHYQNQNTHLTHPIHPTHPTHVTMNISMNMYGNVTNINLRDAGNSGESGNLNSWNGMGTASGSGSGGGKGLSVNDCIKLDVSDFGTANKKASENSAQKTKSWVDDWK